MKQIVKNITANPAPLGLLVFRATTLLLNLHNTGLSAIYETATPILNKKYDKVILLL